MADIAMQVDVAAPPDAAYKALTSTDGIAGWWTTRNETHGTVGAVDRFWFPDAPISWDMEVVEAAPGQRVVWRCVGGPPEWVGTEVRWSLAPTEAGTLVLLDHTGFAEVSPMFRIVTVGWARMLDRLERYLGSGEPAPYFDVKTAD